MYKYGFRFIINIFDASEIIIWAPLIIIPLVIILIKSDGRYPKRTFFTFRRNPSPAGRHWRLHRMQGNNQPVAAVEWLSAKSQQRRW